MLQKVHGVLQILPQSCITQNRALKESLSAAENALTENRHTYLNQEGIILEINA